MAACEFNVDLSSMSVIEGCAKCVVANKCQPGVDAGPHLNAGVPGILKNTQLGFYFRIYGNSEVERMKTLLFVLYLVFKWYNILLSSKLQKLILRFT